MNDDDQTYHGHTGERKLLAQHWALLTASGISPEVAAARGYFSATSRQELEALGFRPQQTLVPALVVPVHDITGRVAFHQSRPDSPRVTEKGREIKYETPVGTRLSLDVPPPARGPLGDPKVPLWFTEGARKADAAVSAGLCCVSLCGVWGWRGTNEAGGKTALACFDSIALNGREVIVAFDSDVMTKQSVNLALAAFEKFLRQRGARVRRVYLPPVEDGGKVGLDDFLSAHGVEELEKLIEQEKSSPPLQEPRRTKLDGEVDALVELVLGQLLPFPNEYTTQRVFHTPAGEPFAVISPSTSFREAGDTLQTVPIRGSAFRDFLAAAYYKQKKRAPSREALAQARYVFEGQARFEGATLEVFTRIGRGPDGALYLDLADDEWRVVRIDKAGWNVVPRSPVRFRRASGMLPLPVPQREGSLEELRRFVNVENDDDFALLVGCEIAAFRATGPYPIVILQGEQGSAKSTTSRVQRRLIDPNKADLRAQPREPRDLAIAANNAWIVCFDNISSVAPWCSDGLCRLATGGGFATRALYTDSDEAIFDAMRPIILNGIDSVATRGDLLDRAILLQLPLLRDVRPEKVFWADFDEARPRLLGALLDAIVLALRDEDEVELADNVRMMDAARWVQAAETALPWESGLFLKAYTANRADANELALEASPVAAELLRWSSGRLPWEGTAGELLKQLNAGASEATCKLKSWPKTAKGLSSALRRLAPNLRRTGLGVGFRREPHTGRRLISLSPEGKFERHDRHHRHPHGESGVSPSTCEPAPDVGRGDANGNGADRPSPDRHPVTTRNPSGGDGGDGGDADFRTPTEVLDL